MIDYNEPRNQLKEMRTEMVRAYASITPTKLRERIQEVQDQKNTDGI